MEGLLVGGVSAIGHRLTCRWVALGHYIVGSVWFQSLLEESMKVLVSENSVWIEVTCVCWRRGCDILV